MITKSNSTKNIDKKIFAVQSAAPVIRKQADNPYFKSKYAEYPEIQADIRPLTIKEGLLVNFAPVIGDQLVLTVKDIETGEYYEVVADLKSGQATPQAQGSAITYLKRYMITAFFDLIIEDAMDDDGNAGSGKKPEPKNANKTNQQDTPPGPEKKELSPDNKKEWDYRVLCLQNKKETLEQISKAFNITEADKALLLKAGSKAKPALKPGSDNWNKAVEFLSKEGNKLETITWKYSISEQDLSDLQTDVMNYQPTENNTTK